MEILLDRFLEDGGQRKVVFSHEEAFLPTEVNEEPLVLMIDLGIRLRETTTGRHRQVEGTSSQSRTTPESSASTMQYESSRSIRQPYPPSRDISLLEDSGRTSYERREIALEGWRS